MIKIRLAKHGAKGNKFYRIVAIDEHRKREGKTLDVIGFWHPSKKSIKIDSKKIEYWTKNGALLSVGVKKLVENK